MTTTDKNNVLRTKSVQALINSLDTTDRIPAVYYLLDLLEGGTSLEEAMHDVKYFYSNEKEAVSE